VVTLSACETFPASVFAHEIESGSVRLDRRINLPFGGQTIYIAYPPSYKAFPFTDLGVDCLVYTRMLPSQPADM